MKRSLLMFSAVAAFVVPAVTPMAVLAQDRGEARQEGPRRERGERNSGNNERRFESRPEQRSERAPRQERQERAQPPARQERAERPAVQQPRQQEQRPRQENRPQRPDGNARNNNRDWRSDGRPDGNRPNIQRPDQNRGDRNDRRNDDRRPPVARPNDPRGNDNRNWDRRDNDRREWRSDNRGQDRRFDRERREREFRNNWNRDQWRRDFDRRHRSDWWRNDNRFRGWSGVRVGFYFAPGYGYYSVPRTYWNRRWQAGQFLPDVFWRYQVSDWRAYGLGYPPPGTRWVYVDNSIYLIDDYDGYIIEVIRDAWRW